ncbi:MAG: hypothetical protein MJZ86_06180 [Bacteroidales bacterium]|nr:hypothetical protein [Bacteroidales bacterium]
MNNSANSLVQGLEKLGLIANRIRQNQGAVPQIEIDIILQQLRELYMTCLQLEKESTVVELDNTLELDLKEAVQKATEEKRLAEEAAAKKAAEEKRIAEERRLAEAVAANKKAAEEKRLAEETAAKKAAEEKRLAEEAAAKKAAEEKRLAEEAAAKKAAEEKRLAEEAAAKKAAEEKRQAEEAAAKKAAEEKRLAEEAAAKKAAEEKRLAEEAAAKKAAAAATAAALAASELKPVFAPDEKQHEETPMMEPQMEKLAGNPNDDLFADEPAPVKEEKPREASLFDYLNLDRTSEQPKVRTIGDVLNQNARNVEQQLETRVNAKKVDDLRTVIAINDKFSFMSELFHNNIKGYNDFIMRLNEMSDREQALKYVEQVAEENKWKTDSPAVQNFYLAFDRKF